MFLYNTVYLESLPFNISQKMVDRQWLKSRLFSTKSYYLVR